MFMEWLSILISYFLNTVSIDGSEYIGSMEATGVLAPQPLSQEIEILLEAQVCFLFGEFCAKLPSTGSVTRQNFTAGLRMVSIYLISLISQI